MDVLITLLVILFVCLIGVIVRWAVNRYKRLQLFKQYGIPGPKPNFFAGNLYELDPERAPNTFTDWLKQYGNVFGYYIGGLPYVVINDIEMLKQIFIKDFHVFSNRPDMFLGGKVFNKTLIALKSQRWKEVRSFLTPFFSTGKIKLMTHIVNEKVDVCLNEVAKKAEKNEMFDIYELIQGLTLDIIAQCAFAMKTHCQENLNDEFLIGVRDFFRYTHNKAVDCALMFPFIASIMGFVSNYMRAGKMTKLIVDNLSTVIKARQEDSSLKGMDMLQIMLDGKKEDLQYLDQVFHETLRIYPPVTGFVSRHCDEDYNVGKYTIPKGATVIAPVWDIHHNPELWPDPWKFDPDRFAPEKKRYMNNMAFLSFGAGRRNCIGARFAVLVAKLAIFRLLKNFTFETCEKTDYSLKLICPTIVINPVNGIWLRAVQRDSDSLN